VIVRLLRRLAGSKIRARVLVLYLGPRAAPGQQPGLRRNDAETSTGLRFWTRANLGQCLLATRRKPNRLAKEVRQVQRFDGQQGFDFPVPPPKNEPPLSPSLGPLFERRLILISAPRFYGLNVEFTEERFSSTMRTFDLKRIGQSVRGNSAGCCGKLYGAQASRARYVFEMHGESPQPPCSTYSLSQKGASGIFKKARARPPSPAKSVGGTGFRLVGLLVCAPTALRNILKISYTFTNQKANKRKIFPLFTGRTACALIPTSSNHNHDRHRRGACCGFSGMANLPATNPD
jgi:hypothetical protein